MKRKKSVLIKTWIKNITKRLKGWAKNEYRELKKDK